MEDQVIHEHRFDFSGCSDNLSITTKFIDNGDDGHDGIYWNQVLTLQGCGNSASFELSGIILDSAALRELANELDRAQIEAEKKKGM